MPADAASSARPPSTRLFLSGSGRRRQSTHTLGSIALNASMPHADSHVNSMSWQSFRQLSTSSGSLLEPSAISLRLSGSGMTDQLLGSTVSLLRSESQRQPASPEISQSSHLSCETASPLPFARTPVPPTGTPTTRRRGSATASVASSDAPVAALAPTPPDNSSSANRSGRQPRSGGGQWGDAGEVFPARPDGYDTDSSASGSADDTASSSSDTITPTVTPPAPPADQALRPMYFHPVPQTEQLPPLPPRAAARDVATPCSGGAAAAARTLARDRDSRRRDASDAASESSSTGDAMPDFLCLFFDDIENRVEAVSLGCEAECADLERVSARTFSSCPIPPYECSAGRDTLSGRHGFSDAGSDTQSRRSITVWPDLHEREMKDTTASDERTLSSFTSRTLTTVTTRSGAAAQSIIGAVVVAVLSIASSVATAAAVTPPALFSVDNGLAASFRRVRDASGVFSLSALSMSEGALTYVQGTYPSGTAQESRDIMTLSVDSGGGTPRAAPPVGSQDVPTERPVSAVDADGTPASPTRDETDTLYNAAATLSATAAAGSTAAPPPLKGVDPPAPLVCGILDAHFDFDSHSPSTSNAPRSRASVSHDDESLGARSAMVSIPNAPGAEVQVLPQPSPAPLNVILGRLTHVAGSPACTPGTISIGSGWPTGVPTSQASGSRHPLMMTVGTTASDVLQQAGMDSLQSAGMDSRSSLCMSGAGAGAPCAVTARARLMSRQSASRSRPPMECLDFLFGGDEDEPDGGDTASAAGRVGISGSAGGESPGTCAPVPGELVNEFSSVCTDDEDEDDASSTRAVGYDVLSPRCLDCGFDDECF